MTGTRSLHLTTPGSITGIGCRRHDIDPVVPIPVSDEHGDRGSEGFTRPYAPEELHLVGLDGHSGPPPMSGHPPPEVVVDVGCAQGHAGGHSLQHGNQSLAVRLTGGREFQHEINFASSSPEVQKQRARSAVRDRAPDAELEWTVSSSREAG